MIAALFIGFLVGGPIGAVVSGLIYGALNVALALSFNGQGE
jgi:hypothetical protein